MKRYQSVRKGTLTLLIITLLSSILLAIYQIFNQNNNIENIILASFILIIYIGILVLTIKFYERRHEKIIIAISSLFLIFNGYTFLTSIGILDFSPILVEDFTLKDINEVMKWAEVNKVSIEQVYEHSDTISKYKIIRQDVEVGTNIKEIKKIVVVVSDGPDEEVETTIPNMVGWNLDDALTFIKDNYLTNVTIEFEFNKKERDTIIEQNTVSAEIKRNEKITLVSSLGNKDDVVEARMEDLVGKSLFDAEIFLKRNRLNYEIQYVYSEEIEEDYIVSQSTRHGFMVRSTDKDVIIVEVAKKDEVSVPDIMNMSVSEITKWATDNKLKVYFEEEYDDTIAKGKIIESSIIKGEIIKPDLSFKIIVSKGKLVMPKFTNVDEFRTWAEENDVSYNIEYEFNNDVETGKLISSSHKTGEVIKNNDAVKIVISQGGKTEVPNFLGKTKEEAESLCNEKRLKCVFQKTSSTKDIGIVIKQSMRSGSNVPSNTTITITVSSGNE